MGLEFDPISRDLSENSRKLHEVATGSCCRGAKTMLNGGVLSRSVMSAWEGQTSGYPEGPNNSFHFLSIIPK